MQTRIFAQKSINFLLLALLFSFGHLVEQVMGKNRKEENKQIRNFDTEKSSSKANVISRWKSIEH